jgi:hypothetical protein
MPPEWRQAAAHALSGVDADTAMAGKPRSFPRVRKPLAAWLRAILSGSRKVRRGKSLLMLFDRSVHRLVRVAE